MTRLEATLTSVAPGSLLQSLTAGDRLAAWVRGRSPAKDPLAALTPVSVRWSPAAGQPLPQDAVHRPSREEIRQVMSRGSGPIRLCYERELLSSTNPREGTLVMRFEIDRAAKAQSLTIVRDSIRLPSLERCLAREIQSLTITPCQGGCIVVYPFEFYLRV